MAKLIYSFGGAFMGEILLEKERTTIGRRTYNDVQIDNLAISGEHAAVVVVGTSYFIEDLESTNGTLLNGKPVRKHVLHHGDIIGLGKYQLRFLDEVVVEDKHGLDTRVAGPQSKTESSPDVSGGAESAFLRVLNGKSVGQTLELSKDLTTLGKPGVHVVAVARYPHGYFAVQIEGEDPPVVNGEQVEAKSLRMNDHDVLEVAGVRLEFLSSMKES